MAKKNAGFIMGAAGKPMNDMPTPGSKPKKVHKAKGKKKADKKRGKPL
jgi:hypothetical protein